MYKVLFVCVNKIDVIIKLILRKFKKLFYDSCTWYGIVVFCHKNIEF